MRRWAFDEAGVLRDVPAAEGSQDWPRRQMLDVFPVTEKVCWHLCMLSATWVWIAASSASAHQACLAPPGECRAHASCHACPSGCGGPVTCLHAAHRGASSGCSTAASTCPRTSGRPSPSAQSWRTPPGALCTGRSSSTAPTGACLRTCVAHRRPFPAASLWCLLQHGAVAPCIHPQLVLPSPLPSWLPACPRWLAGVRRATCQPRARQHAGRTRPCPPAWLPGGAPCPPHCAHTSSPRAGN